MGSRIKQNPETTFEVYVEVAYPRTGGTLSGEGSGQVKRSCKGASASLMLQLQPYITVSSILKADLQSAGQPLQPVCPLLLSSLLFALFLSDDLSFPLAFFGFASTLARAGLADSLAEQCLGSALATPSVLTFLLGKVAVLGGRHVRCGAPSWSCAAGRYRTECLGAIS
ncbi:DENN/MADD domain containing 1A [Cricetulus griseus]